VGLACVGCGCTSLCSRCATKVKKSSIQTEGPHQYIDLGGNEFYLEPPAKISALRCAHCRSILSGYMRLRFPHSDVRMEGAKVCYTNTTRCSHLEPLPNLRLCDKQVINHFKAYKNWLEYLFGVEKRKFLVQL